MSARLLLDEMLSPAIAQRLVAKGIDVECVSARADLRGRPDADVLEAAATERRVVVTRNLADFSRLDAQWTHEGRSHAGIIGIQPERYQEDSRFVSAVTTALLAWSRSQHAHGSSDVGGSL